MLDTMTVTTESNAALVSTDALDQITLDIEIPEEQPPPVPMLKLMKLNGPEWPYILFGCLSAIILGITFPAFAFLYGEMYGVSKDLSISIWLYIIFHLSRFCLYKMRNCSERVEISIRLCSYA